jgi:hypothetical protein
VENSKVLLEFLNKGDGGEGEAEEEDTESDDSRPASDKTSSKAKLLNACKSFLAENTLKIKRMFNTIGLPVSKQDIKPTIPKVIARRVAQLVKVSLAECPYALVIRMLETPEINAFLNKEGIYIHDVDFTRDYAGTFNKTSLIGHMVKNGFGLQGLDGRDRNGMVLDNDKLVGRNCLTFVKTTDNGPVRYKFYNKFVQSMESPGVRTCVGNHFVDWCNNPEPELKKAIDAGLGRGVLRLEITFYRLGANRLLSKGFIEEQMDYLATCLPPELLFYNPIATQWKLLLNHVHYNTCLVDLETKLAFISLYLNKETGKTNGFYIKDITTNKLSNILKLYTFNVPLFLVLVSREGVSSAARTGQIRIQQDVFVKILEHSTSTKARTSLTTYATSGIKVFKKHVAKPEDRQPPTMGLEDNSKCMLRLLTRNEDISKKCTNNINIVFVPIAAPLLGYPQPGKETSMRAIIQKIQQERQQIDFVGANREAIQAAFKKNKDLEEQQRILNERAGIKMRLEELFETPVGNIQKLVDVPDGTILYTFAFRDILTKYGKQYLLICSTESKQTEDAHLTVYWSIPKISQYIDDNKDKWRKIDLDNCRTCWGTLVETAIFKFRKAGFRYTETRHKVAFVEIIAGRTNATELTKVACIQEIGTSSKGLDRIEDLIKSGTINEGDTITIVGKRRLSAILILQAKHKNKDYFFSANQWLKEVLFPHFDRFGGCGSIPVIDCVVGPEKRNTFRINEHTFLVGGSAEGTPATGQQGELQLSVLGPEGPRPLSALSLATKELPVEEAAK